MKIKKYLKKFFRILILSFIIFYYPNAPIHAELGTLAGGDVIFDGYEYRIDLKRFYVINPNPVVKPSNENEMKFFSSNDTPYFTIKNYKNKTSLKPVATTQKEAEDIVFEKIQGAGAINLNIIKLLNDTYKDNASKLAQNPFLQFIKKFFEKNPNIETNNKSLVIIDDYKDFKSLCEKIYNEWLFKTIGSSDRKKSCPFYAGNGLSSSFQKETIDNFKSLFGEPSNITVSGYSVDYVVIDGLPDKNSLNNTKSYNFLSGACFEIKAKKIKNLCTDTLSKPSGAAIGCDNSQNNVYFLPGITCANLNLMLFYSSSEALDTKSEAYKEEFKTAQLKEKTIFKPQISFGDINEGISLQDYINFIYKYLMPFTLVITGFVIVIGGVKYMIGRNDGIPMIKNAFIGFIILSGTYTILKTVNPSTVNLNIIEIGDLERKNMQPKSSIERKESTGTVSGNNDDLSPNPAIEIGSGWYFPVIITDVKVDAFKYNATSKKAGGSFGYLRLSRITNQALEKTPEIVCHHAVDIFTVNPGRVVAITDGTVIASGNSYTNCKGGQVGSIVIQHTDSKGNKLIARYGEIDFVDTTKYKPGATVKAGEPLGNATKCGMLHFEIHAKGNSTPKWRMNIELWPNILKDFKIPETVQQKYQLTGKTITNADQLSKESELANKNCLDSPTAVQALTNDTKNDGKYLQNPSPFLIDLWNKTGNVNKQATQ